LLQSLLIAIREPTDAHHPAPELDLLLNAGQLVNSRFGKVGVAREFDNESVGRVSPEQGQQGLAQDAFRAVVQLAIDANQNQIRATLHLALETT